ncbi:MAG TPA: hypothetical protein VKV26_24785 [Dehalococcoidia bacterium]|nr:hypothetical protein [Dehalococcoidia bacterium]
MSALVRPSAPRVVVPVLPDADSAGVLPLACDLAGTAGSVVLLAVVPVPRGHDLAGPTTAARSARRQLRALAREQLGAVANETVVRAADSLLAGIHEAAGGDNDVLIIALPPHADEIRAVLAEEPYRGLVAAPLCDTIFARPGTAGEPRHVLVSARGGPHAEAALDVALRVARTHGAAVTVMHVDVPGGEPALRQQEQRLFQSLVARSADAPRLRTFSVAAASAEEAVLSEAARHDLLVLGARVGSSRRESDLGALPLAALARSDATVLVVKSRRPVHPALFRPRRFPVEEVVNAWFVENTSHCREYANLAELVAQKQARGLTLGVALLAGESSDTLPAHARVLHDELSTVKLVDEAAFFAGESPELLEAAQATGLQAVGVRGAAPGQRGRLIHASLECMKSDIIVWIDADIRNPHAKLVYGPAGPLLANERLNYVKGFFGTPADGAETDLEALVGELAVRPLLNLFFAELSGVIDPLGVEQAVRRSAARQLPVFSGDAAPLGLLIDMLDRYGLKAIAQVALEERIARPLGLAEANRRSFSAAQVLTSRLGLSGEAAVHERATPTIKIIHQTDERFEVTSLDARESEL